MKTANIMKAVCVAGLAATCVWSLAACTSADASNSATGGVAATVNGAEVAEDDVTAMIESIRGQMGAEAEEAWGQWLADNSMTPISVREEMIDSFAQQELVKQGAKEKGIAVEGSEVDAIITGTKAQFDNDDEKWQAALKQAGYTEEKYREMVENQLMQKKFSESFASNEEPSQEDLLQYSQMYASAYDGAKRSSHILFETGDDATAQSVLDQINAGQLGFADAAKQYSKDGSADKGGDVGWDKMSQFVPEYTEALNGLQKDQVSGLVTSKYGIHIIKCTDVFTAPKEKGEDGTETVKITSIDQLPTEFLDTIKASLKQQKQTEAFQAWLAEYQEKADIKINEMPANLSYAVDMSKYQAATSTDNSGTGATAGGAGNATEGSQGSADNAAPAEQGGNASGEQPAGGSHSQQPAEAA
ncbi:MAG: peptidylprolyl isomerase [Gordonibacter sp.]|uniref:peptidylprolyl isomerase n=1 Tax=Gordonibacter sp. TaxID=1968902 RepID=UPI002FC95E14